MLQQIIALLDGLTSKIYAAAPLYQRQQFVALCDQWVQKARELEGDKIIADAKTAASGVRGDLGLAIAKGGAHEA